MGAGARNVIGRGIEYLSPKQAKFEHCKMRR